MSKDKSREVLRVHTKEQNGKHQIPRVMLEVICALKELDFIQEVGIGRFRQTKKERGVTLVGFEDRRKSYLVNVVNRGYEQKFYLRVDASNEEYESPIKGILTKI